jgi:hypothetical protein
VVLTVNPEQDESNEVTKHSKEELHRHRNPGCGGIIPIAKRKIIVFSQTLHPAYDSIYNKVGYDYVRDNRYQE